ncbi:hypothetical protein P4S72_09235 [Vibrio sp. PP-XX7]
MIHQDEFLEHAEVFGHYYGTSKIWIEHNLDQGIDVFLDIDWQEPVRSGLKCHWREVFLFYRHPKEELARRLNTRGQDSDAVIAQRMSEAQNQKPLTMMNMII